jgi:hypothetical protein
MFTPKAWLYLLVFFREEKNNDCDKEKLDIDTSEGVASTDSMRRIFDCA